MELSLVDLAQARRKNTKKKTTTKDPKHLEIMALFTLSLDWLFSCQGGALFPETYWSKISDLTQWNLPVSHGQT